ncbi:MAG: hypothetical protein K2W96_25185 [Gemmataceae bacterium]|nr:hypothetical protein [Gemmataceae bacterium]
MDWTQAVFGSVLVVGLGVAAGVFGWLQVKELRRVAADAALPDEERRFARRQARRRLWGCGLLALMAAILVAELVFWEPAAEALARQRERFGKEDAPQFTESEKVFLRIWGGGWVALAAALMAAVFLAALDRYSTRTHALRQMRRLQADRRAMVARQAGRMRAERGR